MPSPSTGSATRDHTVMSSITVMLAHPSPYGGKRMMLSSANRLYRKGCTSSSVSGPPRFISSTPTLSSVGGSAASLPPLRSRPVSLLLLDSLEGARPTARRGGNASALFLALLLRGLALDCCCCCALAEPLHLSARLLLLSDLESLQHKT